jgi:[ribosomal protein S5]-alanine N-acetyltransferase
LPDFLFSSERLYFRNFTPEDAPDLLRLHSLPEVLRYVGMPVWNDIKEAIDYQLSCEKNFIQFGYCRWGVYLKESNEFIGLAGILNRPEENYIDLGYRFFPEYWGKGFATESVQAIFKYAFENTDIEVITGYADEDNFASQKVLKKCGLNYKGIGSCLGMPACKFEISKEDYLSKHLI